MKITRKTEIETTEVRVGDQIQVGKYTATCQTIPAQGLALFLLDQYLDKGMAYNRNGKNAGGYAASDVRRDLNAPEILEIFAALPLVPHENGDLLRLATYGEMFGHDEWYKSGAVEPDNDEQWPLMADRLNRTANREGEPYESQKGKGVSFHRREFEKCLRRHYMRYGTNDGYILLVDFSGYYANIPHAKCMAVLFHFLEKEVRDEMTLLVAKYLIREIFKTFEVDVSRFSDEEIAAMMRGKVDPMLNANIPPGQLPGRKMLPKGVDIGSQPSQNIGIVYPYRLDNFAKIVCGIKGYGRYTDDFYAIDKSKVFLRQVLEGFYRVADEYGLIINPRKTRIVKLSSEFRHLQISYSLTETGRVVRKINPKNITRERRKLKAYKRLLDAGKIDYMTVDNSFKSWIGGHWKIMSHIQIYNMSNLYFELFGRRPKWKKGHSRLCWLMAHPPKTCGGTETTISAKPRSPKQPLLEICPP